MYVLQSPNDTEETTCVKSPGGGKARRKSDSKICEVCGDHALGVNFDAVCCESCKAFFRRNALKEKVCTHLKCLTQTGSYNLQVSHAASTIPVVLNDLISHKNVIYLMG